MASRKVFRCMACGKAWKHAELTARDDIFGKPKVCPECGKNVRIISYMQVRFENDFHGTAAMAMAEIGRDGFRLSYGQAGRMRVALCGAKGCTCHGNLGERGRQPNHLTIEPQADGSVFLRM